MQIDGYRRFRESDSSAGINRIAKGFALTALLATWGAGSAQAYPGAVPISRRPSRRIVRLVIPRRAKTIFLDSAIVHWRNCHSTSTTQRFELGRADTAKSRLRWALSIVLIDFFLRSRLPTQAVISVKVAGVIHLSRTSRPDESLYGLTKLVRVQRPDATSSEWSCTGRFAS
jgi:hypothetical protein